MSPEMLVSFTEASGSCQPGVQLQRFLAVCTDLIHQLIRTGELALTRKSLSTTWTEIGQGHVWEAGTERTTPNSAVRLQSHSATAGSHRRGRSFDSPPCSTFISKISWNLVRVCNSERGLSPLSKPRDTVRSVTGNRERIFFTWTGVY